MGRIVCPSVALPPYSVSQVRASSYLERLFGVNGHGWDIARLARATGVEKRHLAAVPDHLIRLRSMRERSEEYERAAVQMAGAALRRCLEKSRAPIRDIGLLITVSTTGFVVPWLDVHLVGELGLRADIRRLPAAAGGCAGSIAAVAVASDYVNVRKKLAAVVAVEVPSVCLQPQDTTRANMIASALFGDGAGACLISGDDSAAGFEILGGTSYIVPHSRQEIRVVMGETGVSVTLSRELPRLIKQHLRPSVDAFLDAQGASAREIEFYVVHPGGPRVLKAVASSLGLQNGELWASWEVLRSVGNTSSASVFFVMHELVRHRPPKAGGIGLLIGIGPGLSFELMLVRHAEPSARC